MVAINLQVYTDLEEILLEGGYIDQTQQVNPESRFSEDFGMDSLDICEFIMKAEKHFGISMPDEEAGNILTLSDACACIQKQLLAKAEKQKQVKNSVIKSIFTKTK
ncbi:MAG: acyl carrier protein [Proteobacteria bacterium]|nr:acyl carrier protein [Candidatus Enterousia scatequi]